MTTTPRMVRTARSLTPEDVEEIREEAAAHDAELTPRVRRMWRTEAPPPPRPPVTPTDLRARLAAAVTEAVRHLPDYDAARLAEAWLDLEGAVASLGMVSLEAARLFERTHGGAPLDTDEGAALARRLREVMARIHGRPSKGPDTPALVEEATP